MKSAALLWALETSGNIPSQGSFQGSLLSKEIYPNIDLWTWRIMCQDKKILKKSINLVTIKAGRNWIFRKVSQQKLLFKLEELRKSLIGLPREIDFPGSELTESLGIASREEFVPDSQAIASLLIAVDSLLSWPDILASHPCRVSISWGNESPGDRDLGFSQHKWIPRSWSSWSSLINICISIGRGGWTNYTVKLLQNLAFRSSLCFFKCLRLRKSSYVQRLVSDT